MAVRMFALLVGGALTTLGLLGFIPSLLSPTVHPPVDFPLDAGLSNGLGDLFGLFTVNTFGNLLMVITGLAGVVCYLNGATSKLYAGTLAVWFGLLGVGGFIPALRTGLGTAPLYGTANIVLHLSIAAIAFYFGFIQTKTLIFNDPQSAEQPGVNPVARRLEEAGIK